MKIKRAGTIYQTIFTIFTVAIISFIVVSAEATLRDYLGLEQFEKVDCSGMPIQEPARENEFVWPVASKKLTSCFDQPSEEHTFEQKSGIYIQLSETETPVYAIESGEVVSIDKENGIIKIDHSSESERVLMSKYQRLKSFCSSTVEGDNPIVEKGQMIGRTHPDEKEFRFIILNKTKGAWKAVNPLKIFEAKKYNIDFEKGLKCGQKTDKPSKPEDPDNSCKSWSWTGENWELTWKDVGDPCEDGLVCTKKDICVSDEDGLKCVGQDYCENCVTCGDGELNNERCNEECEDNSDCEQGVCRSDCTCTQCGKCDYNPEINSCQIGGYRNKPIVDCSSYSLFNVGDWKNWCKDDICNISPAGCKIKGEGLSVTCVGQ